MQSLITGKLKIAAEDVVRQSLFRIEASASYLGFAVTG
jgi:hypothetical protein